MTKKELNEKFTISIGDETYTSACTTACTTVGGIVSANNDYNITYTAPSDYTLDEDALNSGTTLTFDTSTDFAPSFGDLDTGDDTWPSKYRIEDMIDLYPALKLQYDRFVEVYRLCVDDYKSQKEDKDEALF